MIEYEDYSHPKYYVVSYINEIEAAFSKEPEAMKLMRELGGNTFILKVCGMIQKVATKEVDQE